MDLAAAVDSIAFTRLEAFTLTYIRLVSAGDEFPHLSWMTFMIN